MKVIVCAKPVLDPDAVNGYALWGRLQVDQQARWLKTQGIPLLLNAFDEQALELALRLRDMGADLTVTVLVAAGDEATPLLRMLFAMGADGVVLLRNATDPAGDPLVVAHFLAAAIGKLGGADLVLCGRQASDDDQGVVGPALAELLDMPSITVARDIQLAPTGVLRVTRVLPDGEEVVEAALPALVTVSNEVGPPRFPSARGMLEARRKQPTVLTLPELTGGPAAAGMTPGGLRRTAVEVAQRQGHCEFIDGATVQEKALALARRLRNDGLI